MAWNLEIHHINIGHGDSTVIVIRNGDQIMSKVLIDAGTNGQRLVSYLQTYLEDQRSVGGATVNKTLFFDYVIVTHYHDDHIKGFSALGGYVRSGEVLPADLRFQCTSFIDLGGYDMTRTVGTERVITRFDSINGDGFTSATTDMSSYRGVMRRLYEQGATHIPVAFAQKQTGDTMAITGPVVIALPPDDKIKLTCYCAGGVLADGQNTLTQQQLDIEAPSSDVDPNDTSLVFLLEWPDRDFRYLIGGDLSANAFRVANEVDRPLPGGNRNYTTEDTYRGFRTGPTYFDQATPLYRYLSQDGMPLAGDKKLDVLKVPHHGSQHNMNYELLKKYSPRVLIVPTNTMRSLPDAIFLREAHYYCSNHTADIFFVNKLVYSPSKRPKYDWGSQLRAIAERMNYQTNIALDSNGRLILDAASVIVKVAEDRSYTASTVPEETATYFIPDQPNAKYQIIVRKDTGLIVTAPLPTQREEQMRIVSIWKTVTQFGGGSFYPTSQRLLLRDIIEAGIRKQVGEELERWLSEDAATTKTDGVEFIKKYYPALVGTDGVPLSKDDRITRTLGIFNIAFETPGRVKVGWVEADGFPYKEPTLDNEHTTLFHCLNNKYQLLYLYMSQATTWSENNANAISNAVAGNLTREPYWQWSSDNTTQQRSKNIAMREANAAIWTNRGAPPPADSGNASSRKRRGSSKRDELPPSKRTKASDEE